MNGPLGSTGDDASGGDARRYQGRWLSECIADGADSLQRRLIIEDAQFTLEETLHRGGGCQSMQSVFVAAGRFSIGEGSIVSTGDSADHFNGTIETNQVRILSDDAAMAFSQNLFCGRADWQTGDEVDDLACPDLGFELPEPFFDLILRIDDALYRGDDATGAGDEPMSRPTDIDLGAPFRLGAG